MTVYESFCGIGGFSLGFQRAGFKIVGGCEIDPYARAVYKKNFGIEPDRDIRTVRDVSADVICCGFPCQPFSVAGLQLGTEDKRNLWPELKRLICASRPKYVVLENVPALLSIERGTIIGLLLRDLAEGGYDAEWDCLPASAFGAPHQRDRVWIIAYTNRTTIWEQQIGERRSSTEAESFTDCQISYAASDERWISNGDGSNDVSNNHSLRGITSWKGGGQSQYAEFKLPSDRREALAIEPAVGRVAHGVPYRSHRLRCLGNAVVPQIAQWIAERIKEIEVKRECLVKP